MADVSAPVAAVGGPGASGPAGAAASWLPLVSSFAQAWAADPRAVWSSFAMILVSELGDKTFLIAAILAMRQSPLTVFMGAFSALALMSVLSALLGTVFPTLLPKALTTFAAAVLFFLFGAKMASEGIKMQGDEMAEEWQEATKEIDGEEGYAMERLEAALEEEEAPAPPPPARPSSSGGVREGAKNLLALCFSQTFAQAFVLTFLGEWGDRSQIATIALAAAHNVALVSFGTIAGHAICTTAAVTAGSWLAAHISVKHVTLGGATLFVLFGIIYLYEALVQFGEPAAAVPAAVPPSAL